ncbi:MAG: LysM peptidoglycan-binding domain-containing protein [Cytophagales bacterium]|nr:MAG: LysM peptidoglycan-binding domain-containing protein [Cytophagales bacterium]
MNYSRLLICINLFFFCYSLASSNPMDSIGIEKKNGKLFVLHKVEAKETLFSISRKYQASVTELKSENPDVASGLNIGQVIKVPYLEKRAKTIEASSFLLHLVAPKETVYSISKRYKIKADELLLANPALSNGLKEGQELKIPVLSKDNSNAKASEISKNEPKAEAKDIINEEDVQKVVPNIEEEEADASVKKTKSKLTPAPSSGFNAMNEKGYADLMQNTSENLKYWALHKTAPYGTIVQVRNEENDQKIFVRVVGKIPQGSADKSIIKLSPKAMERLGAKSDKIQVSISYFP